MPSKSFRVGIKPYGRTLGNFKELIGRDLMATLESDHHEMPVDRLGAFSKGSRLGTLLWRLKYASDWECYKPAVLLLAKETSLQSAIGYRVCEMAIHEWMLPHCTTCNGAKEMIVGQKRIVCMECEGYGVKRYGDPERDLFLGSRFGPWRKKYNRVQSVMTGYDKAINPIMNAELER